MLVLVIPLMRHRAFEKNEAAQTIDDRRTSRSIKEKHYPNVEMLGGQDRNGFEEDLVTHELHEKGPTGRAESSKR